MKSQLPDQLGDTIFGLVLKHAATLNSTELDEHLWYLLVRVGSGTLQNILLQELKNSC